MKRVTLNGIKRRGLTEWKAREWWARQTVSTWSREPPGLVATAIMNSSLLLLIDSAVSSGVREGKNG